MISSKTVFSRTIFNGHNKTLISSIGYLTGIAITLILVSVTAARGDNLEIENGWLNYKGKAVIGLGQSHGIWRGRKPNITKNDPRTIGPNHTEDLEKFSNSMLKYGYPAYEHSFGLWYDRRRDDHRGRCRNSDKVKPPFYEQPWARSGLGIACDGLTQYDLTKFNPWYFERIREFAQLSDQKGLIFYHSYYNQHALLEQNAHYADFPWRPRNTIQETDLPEKHPAANAFYDTSHPLRQELHRLYIRKVLDEIGSFENVFHFTSQEYTGDSEFVKFWMDVIFEWENEKPGRNVKIGIGAPKDVIDEILADPERKPHIKAIDLRYFWYKNNGEYFGAIGGNEDVGRKFSGTLIGKQSFPTQIYRQTLEYRLKYPNKVLFHSVGKSKEFVISFFMGGGSIAFANIQYDKRKVPKEYIAPKDTIPLQATYNFLKNNLAEVLPKMSPNSEIVEVENANYALSSDDAILIYSLYGGKFTLDLTRTTGAYEGLWFNPDDGETIKLSNVVYGWQINELHTPSSADWLIYLKKIPSE